MAQDSAEKLEHTGPAKNEKVASVPPREQLASTKDRLCQTEKEQSCLSRAGVTNPVPAGTMSPVKAI